VSANTKIEWADHTFNPWIGCTKVSPGCDHCYAEADFDKRRHVVQWGAGNPRKLTSDSNWAQPLRWNAKAGRDLKAWEQFKCVNGFDDAHLIARGMVRPTRPRVFCASLADVFDNEVSVQWRFELMKLICETPHLDWLLLTKRIGNASAMLETAFRAVHHQREGWADNTLPNVWIGATVVNQEEADRDIPKLLAVPAARRFLSMEPLLGPVDLERPHPGPDLNQSGGGMICQPWLIQSGIDWIIVGGESGPNARPMHPDWVRSLRDQCQAAGVPFFFKQWGEWIAAGQADCPTGPPFSRWQWSDGTPFKPYEEDRNQVLFCRAGKKAAGRRLDGRKWNEVPASAEGGAA